MPNWYAQQVGSEQITDNTIQAEDLSVELQENLANLVLQQSVDQNPFPTERLEDGAVTSDKIQDGTIAPADLSSSMQDFIPKISLTGYDDADGTGSVTVDLQDATGNTLSTYFLATIWIADADFSEPDAQTGFTVTSGEIMQTVEANAHFIVRGTAGSIVMDIDTGGAKTVYVMAEFDGLVYSSGAIGITGGA